MEAMNMNMKNKRKGHLVDVSDDFSDFSLSSPASKIRRLDAELPPIIEEDEEPPAAANVSLDFQHQQPPQKSAVVVEELPGANQERAIVLFKPLHSVNSPFPQHSHPSPFNLSVDSDIMSGFKSQYPWWTGPNGMKSANDESVSLEESNVGDNNQCKAVVPWVPSQFPPTQGGTQVTRTETETPELMEAEDIGESTMDVEDYDASGVPGHGNGIASFAGREHQWPQQQLQHCMIPQLPHNFTTPITWSG